MINRYNRFSTQFIRKLNQLKNSTSNDSIVKTNSLNRTLSRTAWLQLVQQTPKPKCSPKNWTLSNSNPLLNFLKKALKRIPPKILTLCSITFAKTPSCNSWTCLKLTVTSRNANYQLRARTTAASTSTIRTRETLPITYAPSQYTNCRLKSVVSKVKARLNLLSQTETTAFPRTKKAHNLIKNCIIRTATVVKK